ncbi:hypothetical protein DL93DRAFT_2169272 [Clavulina sp. PMI_390]|nr:hypothetical protein DL93DRAFT_2169272 [Clavulina sp. PMI_390]
MSLSAQGDAPSADSMPPPPQLEDYQAADYVIYAMLMALALFACVSFPRVSARLSFSQTAKKGWRFKREPSLVRNSTRRPRPSGHGEVQNAEEKITTPRRASSTRSLGRRSTDLNDLTRRWAEISDASNPRIPPKHVPSLRTLLYPLSSQLSQQIMGYSLGQVVVLFAYTALICLGLFILSSPVSNPTRAGWIALSQIPVAFLLASKNSLIGFLVGKGYEKLNYLHRWVGQIIFVASLFHGIPYLVIWITGNVVANGLSPQDLVTGMIPFSGIIVITFTSLPFMRNIFWTVFAYGHRIGFVTFVVGVWIHRPAAIPWSIAAGGIYALDLILRAVQARYTSATVEYLPTLQATRVVVPSLRSGWRAGQHVRLFVLSTGMGVMNAVESHPFTIASISEDREGIVLYCHEAGDWTRQLAKLAMEDPAAGVAAKEAGLGSKKTVSVLVQGPYGGPGNVIFSSFSSSMFICGGSGITFGLSATQDVIRDLFEGSSHVRIIDLVWVVKDPAALISILPTFKRLIAASESISSVSLHIHVHYTRVSDLSHQQMPGPEVRPGSVGLAGSRGLEPPKLLKLTEHAPPASSIGDLNLPEAIKLVPGRPDFGDMLAALCDCTSGIENPPTPGGRKQLYGVVVGACGPESLMDSVRKAEHAIGRSVRNAIGGVELVEEAFAW